VRRIATVGGRTWNSSSRRGPEAIFDSAKHWSSGSAFELIAKIKMDPSFRWDDGVVGRLATVVFCE
jgi:hypothetical protein